jgi:hypothetical protein
MKKGAQGGGYVKGGENVSQKEERGKGNNHESLIAYSQETRPRSYIRVSVHERRKQAEVQRSDTKARIVYASKFVNSMFRKGIQE